MLTQAMATLARPGSLAVLKERDIRMPGNADLIEAFHAQSRACDKLGSPFLTALLSEAAGEIGRTGSISGLLASWPGDPVADAVPLRLAAARHALVLSDAAPELAAFYLVRPKAPKLRQSGARPYRPSRRTMPL